jgi:glycosyltransferase involved in cell wall biosynthesis
MVTIPHGLPAQSLPGSVPQTDTSTIVFQGRLVSTKGVHTLLQAAHLISGCEFKIKIIGDGPERARLEAEVATLNLKDKVEFLGYLPSDQAKQILAEARAVVMPSLGGEVFGLVALENMQRGKAVIVSAIGALSEVVGDAGLTFPPGDAEALANCLRRVLQNDGFAEETAARASKRAGSLFTVEQMVLEHFELYQRLVPTSPSRQGVVQVA